MGEQIFFGVVFFLLGTVCMATSASNPPDGRVAFAISGAIGGAGFALVAAAAIFLVNQ